MESRKLQKLTIDWGVFKTAFDRDADFHDPYPQSICLDRQTGEIILFFENDNHAWMEAGIPAEENRAARQQVESMPDRFLEIPGLSHGAHHQILKEFLDSDWTDDEELRQKSRGAYFRSIGGWMRNMDDQSIIYKSFEFRDQRLAELQEEFLRSHGIEPNWK